MKKEQYKEDINYIKGILWFMKKIDLVMMFCILSIIVIGIVYIFLDTIFSFGIVIVKKDIRLTLIFVEYVFSILLIIILLIKKRNRNKK